MKTQRTLNLVAGLCVLAILAGLAPATAEPLYIVFGRAFVVHESADEVASTYTAALPGATPVEPDPLGSGVPPAPLAGVTVEVFELPGNNLLGTGQANLDGFFRVEYRHPLADHEVLFRVSLVYAGGGEELIGEKAPVLIDDQLFGYELVVSSDSPFAAGTAMFSDAGQFMFIQVGHIEMHNIYDQEQDFADPSRWGLTKPPAPGHARGPDWAFGRNLDLYGLIEEGTAARYYKINYDGPEAGTIQTPLWKFNYVIGASGIEVYRRLLGPKDVGPLTGVYELDEFLDGEPIPDYAPRVYSSFWTRPGLRGIFDTDRGSGSADDLPDGKYTLSLQTWNAAFGELVPAVNPYSTLSLHLVNEPPEAKIHNLQYLDGAIALDDVNPCQTVELNADGLPSTDDDNLQFEITARHPVRFPDPADPSHSGVKSWQLAAWHGHDISDGTIATETYPFAGAPPDHDVFTTPGGISYVSCAYRFLLRVWPRITNGYHTVYVRDDNWYATLDVMP